MGIDSTFEISLLDELLLDKEALLESIGIMPSDENEIIETTEDEVLPDSIDTLHTYAMHFQIGDDSYMYYIAQDGGNIMLIARQDSDEEAHVLQSLKTLEGLIGYFLTYLKSYIPVMDISVGASFYPTSRELGTVAFTPEDRESVIERFPGLKSYGVIAGFMPEVFLSRPFDLD